MSVIWRIAALALLVQGCVEAAPSGPSPALQKVISACDAGNLQACQTLVEMEQQNRQAALAYIPAMQTQPLNPQDFMSQRRFGSPAQQQVCPNGRIVPYPGYCPAY